MAILIDKPKYIEGMHYVTMMSLPNRMETIILTSPNGHFMTIELRLYLENAYRPTYIKAGTKNDWGRQLQMLNAVRLKCCREWLTDEELSRMLLNVENVVDIPREYGYEVRANYITHQNAIPPQFKDYFKTITERRDVEQKRFELTLTT